MILFFTRAAIAVIAVVVIAAAAVAPAAIELGTLFLHRCHDSLEDSLNERNGEPDDDTCAWCEESEGVNLFLCDKQDCGR